ADGVERAVPERELPVEASEEIETEDRDGIDERERDLEDVEVLRHERDHGENDQSAAEQDPAPDVERNAGDLADRRLHGLGCGSVHGHTLVTTGRPNRPLGFTHSTATMM